MRAVIQRVSEAKVSIAGVVKGAIQHGLAVLLAVEAADTAEDIEWLSGKIVRLRVFNDENGVMNRSVQEAQGGILLVREPAFLQPVGPAGNRGAAVSTIHRPAGAGFGQVD
jgi:D-tyrosyl-tRNA(Tyr) deacylase